MRLDGLGVKYISVCKALIDSVPHLPLLKKLENHCFNYHILHWVSGYLAIVVPNLLWLMVNLLCLLLLFLEYHRHCSWSPSFSELY